MSPGISIHDIGASLVSIIQRMGPVTSSLSPTTKQAIQLGQRLQNDDYGINLLTIHVYLLNLINTLDLYSPVDSRHEEQEPKAIKIAVARTLLQALQSKVEDRMKKSKMRRRIAKPSTPEMYGSDSEGSGTWADDEYFLHPDFESPEATDASDDDGYPYSESEMILSRTEFGPYMSAQAVTPDLIPEASRPIQPLLHIEVLEELARFQEYSRINDPFPSSEQIDSDLLDAKHDAQLATIQGQIKNLSFCMSTSEEIDQAQHLNKRFAMLIDDLKHQDKFTEVLGDVVKAGKVFPSSADIDSKLGLSTLPAFVKSELNPTAELQAKAGLIAAALKASVSAEASAARPDSAQIDKTALSAYKRLKDEITANKDADRPNVQSVVDRNQLLNLHRRQADKAAQLKELEDIRARLSRPK